MRHCFRIIGTYPHPAPYRRARRQGQGGRPRLQMNHEYCTRESHRHLSSSGAARARSTDCARALQTSEAAGARRTPSITNEPQILHQKVTDERGGRGKADAFVGTMASWAFTSLILSAALAFATFACYQLLWQEYPALPKASARRTRERAAPRWPPVPRLRRGPSLRYRVRRLLDTSVQAQCSEVSVRCDASQVYSLLGDAAPGLCSTRRLHDRAVTRRPLPRPLQIPSPYCVGPPPAAKSVEEDLAATAELALVVPAPSAPAGKEPAPGPDAPPLLPAPVVLVAATAAPAVSIAAPGAAAAAAAAAAELRDGAAWFVSPVPVGLDAAAAAATGSGELRGRA